MLRRHVLTYLAFKLAQECICLFLDIFCGVIISAPLFRAFLLKPMHFLLKRQFGRQEV